MTGPEDTDTLFESELSMEYHLGKYKLNLGRE